MNTRGATFHGTLLHFASSRTRFGVRLLFAIIALELSSTNVTAQEKPYQGPIDPAGDPSAMRVGLMNGNRVSLRIINNIALGGWPNVNVSLWPNDATGLNVLDNMSLIVSSPIFIEKSGGAVDSIPVTDAGQIQALANAGGLDTLWYAVSSTGQTGSGYLLTDPSGTIEYGLYPCFGYFNPSKANNSPALSSDYSTWPSSWPADGYNTKWPGEWDGRFGRGVKYADLEGYYVANDAQDQAYLQSTSLVKYYPRPGVTIGGDSHFSSQWTTVQNGYPWGGLGLRVQARAYQWNNPQSRDAVFFEYDISNLSQYDITQAVFGFYIDAANGNKAPTSANEDQIGAFDTLKSFMYEWSVSGKGVNGLTPGVDGWAFLESPSLDNDGVDNNSNGMIDESRDDPAETWPHYPQYRGPIYEATTPSAAYLQTHYGVPPVAPGGVKAAFIATHDTAEFLKYYNYKSLDDVPAIRQKLWWPGDENGDWIDGNDENGDGKYDNGENPGDDVGTDGVGPGDLNYTGPDADGSECNHRPDYTEGVGCEPNFDATDVNESDMLGLTSFHMFPHPGTSSPQLKYQKDVYALLAPHIVQYYYALPSNLYASFGTGTFRFYAGRTERLSMGMVNSYEPELVGRYPPGAPTPTALYTKLQVVEGIYQTSYRFLSPPVLPTLTAKAGDGRVYLSWDNAADKLTRDPLLANINDFEGYKIYKATDKHFQDAQYLGDASGYQPIFQCDKIDTISGYVPWGYLNGVGYYLGNNGGIQHYFVDNNVENGRTYYYAVVAYNYGLQSLGQTGVSIPPSENNVVVITDETDNVVSEGRNIAAVIPRQEAAGYVPPNFTITDPAGVSSYATVRPSVYNPDVIKPGHQYKVIFKNQVVGHIGTAPAQSSRDHFITTVGYSVYDVSAGDTVYTEAPNQQTGSDNWTVGRVLTSSGQVNYSRVGDNGITSDVFDGMQLYMKPKSASPSLDTTRSGWITGSMPIQVTPNTTISPFFAYDFDIVFFDTTKQPAYSTQTNDVSTVNVLDVNSRRIPSSQLMLNHRFPFYVLNKDYSDSLDEVLYDANNNGIWDPDSDWILVGYPVGTTDRVFGGTVFGFRFPGGASGMPKPGDVYQVSFTRALRDSVMFTVNVTKNVDVSSLKSTMDQIKVVPNPYIVTNTMEPYVSNPGFNQRRVLMFTHVPAQSTIRIFTSSGVFIRQLDVDNAPDNGIVQWDMLTKEGLEIAAGIYIYDVKSKVTGQDKIGKFAVIK